MDTGYGKAVGDAADCVLKGLMMRWYDGLESLEPRMLLSAFVVDSLADSHDVDLSDGVAADELGRVTLRAAIEQCNALEEEGHVITFAEELTGEILLEHGQMAIDGEVEVVGPGAEALVINGDEYSRHFQTGTFSDVVISGLTLTGGESLDYGGAIACYGSLVINDCVINDNHVVDDLSLFERGGGIYIASDCVVEINRSIICDNTADGVGGGIVNVGRLTINDSFIRSNRSWLGGGILNNPFGTLALHGVVIEENSAENGGGIANGRGNMVIHNSSIVNNQAESNGGGIYCTYPNGTSHHELVNTTISGNTAVTGAGIFTSDPIEIINVTISNNYASGGYGGIVSMIPENYGGVVRLGNSIVSDNVSHGEVVDIVGSVESLGHNLIELGEGLDWLGATDLVGVDAHLLPLADNGGNLLTHRLGETSAAIDAGDGDLAPVTDSRGLARFDMAGVVDAGAGALTYSDIGAIEAYETAGYKVTGGLWYDVDGDGEQDVDELAVQWAGVKLHRDDGDGVFGDGDVLFVRANVDGDGMFVFEDLLAGDYWVVGDVQSLGLSGCAVTAAGGAVKVTVGESQLVDEARLGYQPRGGTFAVNTLWDVFDDSGDASDLSLREALHLVDRMAVGRHRIEMQVEGVFSFECTSDPLVINGAVELVGLGAERLTINAGGRDGRVFELGESSDVVLSGMTITGGYVVQGNEYAGGGGIFSAGKLVINDCVIKDNHAEGSRGSGGGIYIAQGSVVEMNRTVVTDNVAIGMFGGGIGNWGKLIIRDSVISDNDIIRETGYGGGIYSFTGTETTLDRVTIQGNTAGYGGGIFCSGRMLMTNCTVAENRATRSGGGIACVIPSSINPSIEVVFSTIADNTAGKKGGGVYQHQPDGFEYEPVILDHVIIANNDAVEGDDDIGGVVVSKGFNLIGDVGSAEGYVASDLLNVDAGLGELTDGGGGMMYYPLERGSLAVDGGGVAGSLEVDQLGKVRPVDGNSDGVVAYDIGAYEADYVGFGDFNLDGSVGLLDLNIISRNWGRDDEGVGFGDGDANGDGVVGLLDLDILGREWGLVYMGLKSQGILYGQGCAYDVDWWEIELEEEKVLLF